MRAYRLDRLSDAELIRGVVSLVRQDRSTTAALLAHVAEVDARKLYLPAGYASMHAYCVGELRLSEDAAAKRIQAARAAREFPQAFEMLADGRIHLTGLGLLAPHLRSHNANELLALTTHKTKGEIEQLIAARNPRTESLPLVCGVAAASVAPCQHAPAHVGTGAACTVQDAPVARAKVAAIAAQRFVIQVTVSQETRDKLQRLTELLSHVIPGGDLAEVLDYALQAAITQVEKRKYGASRARNARPTATPRHVPAQVRRAVYERDGCCCTFVADDGHQCEARHHLELDHIEPLARGGATTVENLRLLCRAHNQFQAERAFGAGFMEAKRERAAEEARARADHERHLDVIAALRSLQYRAEQARHAAERTAAPDLTLEQHVRAALAFLRPQRGVGSSPLLAQPPRREAGAPSRRTPRAQTRPAISGTGVSTALAAALALWQGSAYAVDRAGIHPQRRLDAAARVPRSADRRIPRRAADLGRRRA